jgi:hypothetical protein
MAAEISLNCWILGLDDARAFSVDIFLSKTVDHLKDAIKKKKEPALDHIAADQLDIWQVKRSRAAYPPLLTCRDTFTAHGTPS